MSNFEEFAQAVGRDVKAINQKPEPRLTLTGNTLGIVGGNRVTLPIQQSTYTTLSGAGTPEGKVVANPGDTYVNKSVVL